MPIPIADGIQAGLGIVQGAIGLINASKTKREAELLNKTRPQYSISPLAGQDLSLTKSELSQGLSSAAQQAYNDLNNQQFSSSLSAILKGGGDVNSIGEVYGNNQEGRLKLAMIKDQLRLQQIQNEMNASKNYQQEQQTAWQLNEFAPYNDRVAANGQARLGSQQQIWNGVNTFGSAAIQAANTMQENNAFNPRITGATDNNFDAFGRSLGVPNIPNNAVYPNSNVLTQQVSPFPYTGYPTNNMQNNFVTPYGTHF